MKVEECDDGGRSFESVGEEENILKEKIGDQSTNEASNLNQIEDDGIENIDTEMKSV